MTDTAAAELQTYRTKVGKRGVICPCGRRALVTPEGRIFRHSPTDVPPPGGWCAYGGRLVVEVSGTGSALDA